MKTSHHRTNGLSESNLFYSMESKCQVIYFEMLLSLLFGIYI